MKKTHKPSLNVVLKHESGLTAQQEKFCQIYATGDYTQTEAARQAGYAESNAAWMASKFLNGRDHPEIIDRIRQIKAELGRKYEVTFENHISKLAQIRDAALEAGNYPAAVSAEKSRGQAAGLYIDRKEIMMGKIDQMSKDEVMREIAKLQAEFPQLKAPDLVLELKATEIKDE